MPEPGPWLRTCFGARHKLPGLLDLSTHFSHTERIGYLTERIVKGIHLCIDMQNIFAKGGLWETPWMERVLPTIEAVAAFRTK